jgi:hypothetical protein
MAPQNTLRFLVLGLLSVTAHAASVYVADTSVTFYNTLEPDGKSLTGSPVAFSGTCTVSGAGVVDCTGVGFSNNAPQPGDFSYTDGTWSTTVGGSAITHSESCVESGTTVCSSTILGLTGQWTTGIQNGGSVSNNCTASAYFAAGLCDQVAITEANGVLTIIEQSGFIPGVSNSYAGFVYRFTAVPVPAAAWLIAPAVALVAPWVKRRRVRDGSPPA